MLKNTDIALAYEFIMILIISACSGFLLIFIAPYSGGYFKDWFIHLIGNYYINVFEAFVIPIIYGSLIYYVHKKDIRIKKSEQILYLSIILIIIFRMLSLLVADNIETVQWFSIFRYIETLVVIYIFTKLFSGHKNRKYFIKGIIIGVIIETVGGIFIFLKNYHKGVFISNTSYILQVFLIIVCILVFMNRRRKFLMSFFILVIILAVLATLSRTSWIFLIISLLIFALVYSKKQGLRNVLFFIIFAGIVVLLIGKMLPSATDIFINRSNVAFSGRGTVLYRFYLWDMALGSFFKHPILGIGSGSFARQQENLSQLFNIELQEHYRKLNLQLTVHSTFFGVLSETGIVGLSVYLLWIIAIIGICKKAIRSSNIYSSHDKYIIAITIIVISLIVFDIITQCSFTLISSIFIGFVCGWLREKNRIYSLKRFYIP